MFPTLQVEFLPYGPLERESESEVAQSCSTREARKKNLNFNKEPALAFIDLFLFPISFISLFCFSSIFSSI